MLPFFKNLRRHGSLNLAIVATLAVAMAAGMVISGLLDSFLQQPLPHIDDTGVVLVAERDPKDAGNLNRISWDMARQLRQQAKSFSAFAIASNAAYTVHGPDNTEVAYIPRVSPELFSVLGVTPQLGNIITPANWEVAGQTAFVMSDELWRRRFAASPGIIGESIRLDDHNVTVVGVLPRGFNLNIMGTGQQGWLAMEPERIEEARRSFTRHYAFARLADGTSAGAAQSEVARLGTLVREEFGHRTNQALVTTAQPLREAMLGPFQKQLWILLYLATLVLLVGCLNCTALLLTQALHRRREFAVRQALGASSGRLMRQFWLENSIITIVAAGAALLLAAWASPALARILPPVAGVEGFAIPTLTFRITLIAVAVAITLATAFALVPWLVSRTLNLESALRSGGRLATSGFAGKAGSWLVTVQVMAAFVLTAGAVVLVKSGRELNAVDYGFPLEEIYQFRVSVRGEEFARMETRTQFFEAVRKEINQLPGVQAVSSAFLSYPRPAATESSFVQRGDSVPLAESLKQVTVDAVSPEFFQTHDLRAVAGRLFDSGDRVHTRRVAVVSAEFAERYWPNGSPIGEEVRLQRTGGEEWWEIVGVIPDRLSSGHQPETIHSILLPMNQFTPTGTALFVRHGAGPAPPLETLQRAVWKINPDASIFFESAMTDYYADSAWQQRFSMTLLIGFAGLAVILCTAGLFAVLSFSVASRDRELGIRSALGATSSDLRAQVFKGAAVIVISGLVGGAAVSLFALRSLESLVFNVPAISPFTFMAAAIAMGCTCILAAWFPARHAGKVDPMIALRND